MDSERIEEKLAHLMRTADDLSQIVGDQATRIEQLERRVQMLMEREAEREADGGGAEVVGDRPPPHW